MKKVILLLSVGISLILAAGPAFGFSLWLDPVSQQIYENGTASVDLWVGELNGDFALDSGTSEHPSLGAYDLSILFDDTILGFNNAVFTDFLAVTVDNVAYGSNTFAQEFSPGYLNPVRIF